MQFDVRMRDGARYEIEASYVEVANGPTSSSYTLLGAVPGYPTAILAAFPVDLVLAIIPLTHVSARVVPPPSTSTETGPLADQQVPTPSDLTDLY